MVLRGSQGLAQDVFKSSRHALVGGHTPLECDAPADLLSADHLLEIVMGNCIREPCCQVIQLIARLLVMNEVRLHEYRAPCTKVCRCLRGKGKITKVSPNRNLQTAGLFLEEGACSCSTNLVHLKIDDSALFTSDVLGILAPNLNKGINLRVQMEDCTCLGRDFINHHIRPHKITNKITPASGYTHTANTDTGADPHSRLFKPCPDGLNRLPTGVKILLGHNAPFGVHEHNIGADCTHIDA